MVFKAGKSRMVFKDMIFTYGFFGYTLYLGLDRGEHRGQMTWSSGIRDRAGHP